MMNNAKMIELSDHPAFDTIRNSRFLQYLISLFFLFAIVFVLLAARRLLFKGGRGYGGGAIGSEVMEEEGMVEGFVGQQRPVRKTPDKIYDTFYAGIYDQLFYIPEKNKFELQELQGYFLSQYKNRDNVSILDLGCGTGHHLKELSRSYPHTTGIDQSQAMINVAKNNSPKSHFVCKDFMDRSLFPAASFTHILSYYFTVYYVENKAALARNIYYWLKPGGVWAVHVVNRSKFDPLLDNTSPFPAFSLQKYADKRITESSIHFNNFKYRGKFNMIEKTAIDKMEGGGGVDGIKSNYDQITEFDESFAFKKQGKRTRRHKHTLYMPRIKEIIHTVEGEGLRYLGNSHLLQCGCEYQYILYFKRDKVKGESGSDNGEGIGESGKGAANNSNIIRPANDESSQGMNLAIN